MNIFRNAKKKEKDNFYYKQLHKDGHNVNIDKRDIFFYNFTSMVHCPNGNLFRLFAQLNEKMFYLFVKKKPISDDTFEEDLIKCTEAKIALENKLNIEGDLLLNVTMDNLYKKYPDAISNEEVNCFKKFFRAAKNCINLVLGGLALLEAGTVGLNRLLPIGCIIKTVLKLKGSGWALLSACNPFAIAAGVVLVSWTIYDIIKIVNESTKEKEKEKEEFRYNSGLKKMTDNTTFLIQKCEELFNSLERLDESIPTGLIIAIDTRDTVDNDGVFVTFLYGKPLSDIFTSAGVTQQKDLDFLQKRFEVNGNDFNYLKCYVDGVKKMVETFNSGDPEKITHAKHVKLQDHLINLEFNLRRRPLIEEKLRRIYSIVRVILRGYKIDDIISDNPDFGEEKIRKISQFISCVQNYNQPSDIDENIIIKEMEAGKWPRMNLEKAVMIKDTVVNYPK